jgi:hypothetical protein
LLTGSSSVFGKGLSVELLVGVDDGELAMLPKWSTAALPRPADQVPEQIWARSIVRMVK